MKKPFLTLIALLMASLSFAQSEKANEVMNTLRLANNYFMAKYADPTLPTNVNKIRPSSLWTRAVYYEGLMALYEIDNDQRYIDYTDRWASFHKWEPRNGVKTNDADDQCCGQTYADRYFQSGGEEKIARIIENLNNQMKTAGGPGLTLSRWRCRSICRSIRSQGIASMPITPCGCTPGVVTPLPAGSSM